MHLVLKGLELEIVDMIVLFLIAPGARKSCWPSGGISSCWPSCIKKAFLSVLGTEKQVFLRTPDLFTCAHSKMCFRNDVRDCLFFQVNITSLLHTQVFITRLPSIFYNCTILKITSRPFFAFSDVRFLKMFSKIFESNFWKMAKNIFFKDSVLELSPSSDLWV